MVSVYITINPEPHTDTQWSCRHSLHTLRSIAELKAVVNYRLANLNNYYLAVMDCWRYECRSN